MAELSFYHPNVRITAGGLTSGVSLGTQKLQSVEYIEDNQEGSTLFIDIKPNQISWPFGINTAAYPTYAGEVVQILSAYMGTFYIEGDIRTYRDMELIHSWFINYFYIATQGKVGAEEYNENQRYDETPVKFSYPHRGWELNLRPINLPSFKYGTEVIVPSWTVEASVVEDENMNFTTFNNEYAPKGVTEGLARLNASFGELENPFAYYSGYNEEAKVKKFLKNQAPLINPNSEQLENWYHSIVENLAKGDLNLNEYIIPVSKPVTKPKGNVSQEVLAGAGSNTSFGTLPTNPLEEENVPKTSGSTARINAKGVAAAPTQAPGAIISAIGGGNQIINTSYNLGGGHGVKLSIVQSSYDCSSSTSYVLFKAGVLGSEEALDSAGLAEWGEPGPGEWITVYSNPGAGEKGHAFIVVAGIMMNTVHPPGFPVNPPAPNEGPRWFPGASIQWSIKDDLGGAPFAERHPKGF